MYASMYHNACSGGKGSSKSWQTMLRDLNTNDQGCAGTKHHTVHCYTCTFCYASPCVSQHNVPQDQVCSSCHLWPARSLGLPGATAYLKLSLGCLESLYFLLRLLLLLLGLLLGITQLSRQIPLSSTQRLQFTHT